MSLFRQWLRAKQKRRGSGSTGTRTVSPEHGKAYTPDEIRAVGISGNLKQDREQIRVLLGDSTDVTVREFSLGPGGTISAMLMYMNDLVDPKQISDNILAPLMKLKFDPGGGNLSRQIADSGITVGEVEEETNLNTALEAMLSGKTALFLDGANSCLILGTTKSVHRPVADSVVEPVVRGPREAFTEIADLNITMIRRRLKSPNLVVENMQLGVQTKTQVTLIYLKGVVDPELVTEVKRRLNSIEIDGVLESQYLEELIQDVPYSPFPQIGNTERPDRAVSTLLQGRVVILTDGTPFALWAPARLADLLQSPEDYYQGFIFSTVLRWLRYLTFAVSLTLPSLYIAITTFHQEMIPPSLLISIASYREGVPFPAFVEALIMELTFEALREAGLRLPQTVGQAVSIVGALVIGQAAIAARIVSPLMVIVVALTGVASFMIPNFSLGLSFRLLRFPLMVLAASLGLFGVITGIFFILIHLTSLRSFGLPYTAPFAPVYPDEFKDTLIRAPWWAMRTRPHTGRANWRRQPAGQKPEPPSPEGNKR